jgi:transketolase
MRRMMPATVAHRGPIYIRLGKGGDPIVAKDVPFQIGKAVPMREGDGALIISTGIMLKSALDAATALETAGINAAVLHVPTVKPLDQQTILEFAWRVPVIVTAEEHTIIGGLGSAVAELLAETDFETSKRFRRIGLPDAFPDQYGSQASLLKRYDVTTERIVSVVEQLSAK